MAKILIFGLPGAGKTYLAGKIKEYLGDKVEWFNADEVRKSVQDWDFSEAGRKRQFERMQSLCVDAEKRGKIAIAEFVAPYEEDRKAFGADFTVFVDTIDKGRFEDTNKVFERPTVSVDYHVTEHNDTDAKTLAWILGDKFLWDNTAPTTQMLGRFQPWHEGHQALFKRALAKHNQVFLMIRDMPVTDSNPFSSEQVVENIRNNLTNYAGSVKIQVVPNIMNITYGRDVGYKIEQEVFDDKIHSISATKIREQMKKEGKL